MGGATQSSGGEGSIEVVAVDEQWAVDCRGECERVESGGGRSAYYSTWVRWKPKGVLVQHKLGNV